MLSTLAVKKLMPKAFSGVRVLSITPCRQAAAVAQSSDAQVAKSQELAPYEDLYPSSENIPISLEEKVANWKRANEIFFGPERDFKNFPHPVMPVTVAETYHFGIIPTRWFKALYPKLGVSGGYTVTLGTILFLLSKELFVLTYETIELIALFSILNAVRWKWGDNIKNFLDRKQKEKMDFLYHTPLHEATKGYKTELTQINTEIERKEAIPTIFEAKREQVDLQLEAEYRERLANVYATVRNRLEYQADLEHTVRSFEQTHMVNWIVNSVKKGITPQQEKDSIASCIRTLKGLSATASI